MVNHSSVTILDETVPSRDFDGTVYVAMRPLVEALGLAWKPQYLVLKNRYGAQARLMPFQYGQDGQCRRMLGLPLATLNDWAYSINLNKVHKGTPLNKLVEFREQLDIEAEAAAEEILINARVMRLGEQYRGFPIQPVERKLMRDLRKTGHPLSPLSAILGYPYIMAQAKSRMDMIRVISDE